MSTQVIPRLTLDEYFAIEEKSEIRHEFIDGAMYAMSGGSLRHAAIEVETLSELAVQLRGSPGRAVVADLRLYVPAFDIATYPDIVVRCGPDKTQARRNDTITDATVIVEVLSLSTKNYDRSQKFEYYRSLPSFQEYVLLEQDRMKAEHWARMPDRSWIFREFSAVTDIIELKSIGCRLELQALYRGVDFAAEQEA